MNEDGTPDMYDLYDEYLRTKRPGVTEVTTEVYSLPRGGEVVSTLRQTWTCDSDGVHTVEWEGSLAGTWPQTRRHAVKPWLLRIVMKARTLIPLGTGMP